MADEQPQLPPIEVEPSSAPFELPATHKTCPDCEREVPATDITYPRDSLRPLSEFYMQKAKRYEGGVRYSAYCIPHQRLRNNAYRKARPKTEQDRATTSLTAYAVLNDMQPTTASASVNLTTTGHRDPE